MSFEVTPYQFAKDVVERLQQAGYQALFAGGCVRDRLMGREPKDYDVATSARPEQVRELFGMRRTLPIGVSFGVIAILGPKTGGLLEVATFRRESDYRDGRHPEHVEFTDAREDAQRRDFTINGLFFDPVTETVLDFVDGRRDLDERVIRAIGDPLSRISEDKLRMLRAIRFAATLGFQVEPQTLLAVERCVSQIHQVSGERIGDEMRKMLAHPGRRSAAELLAQTGLLRETVDHYVSENADRANWRTRLRWMEQLGEARFEVAVELLLSRTLKQSGIAAIADRWKLSRAEQGTISWIHQNWLELTRSKHRLWSEVQPLLIHEAAPLALHLAETAMGLQHAGVEFCKKRLAWPKERLDPPPLLDGNRLRELGFTPGPSFSTILKAIRSRQLDGELATSKEAEEFALAFNPEIR